MWLQSRAAQAREARRLPQVHHQRLGGLPVRQEEHGQRTVAAADVQHL